MIPSRSSRKPFSRALQKKSPFQKPCKRSSTKPCKKVTCRIICVHFNQEFNFQGQKKNHRHGSCTWNSHFLSRRAALCRGAGRDFAALQKHEEWQSLFTCSFSLFTSTCASIIRRKTKAIVDLRATPRFFVPM